MTLTGPAFLFLFLPAVFCLHLLIPEKYTLARNIVLLTASLLFLGFGDPLALLLMLFTALWSWGSAWLMRNQLKRRALFCAGGVLGCLLPLLIFRYADFFAASVNDIAGTAWKLPGLHLPLGIAFFTLQGISYVCDVYRCRAEAQKYFYKVLLWLSFFPQLISGPVVRWNEVGKAIDTRSVTAEGVTKGLRRMIVGLAKKLLLADTLAAAVNAAFSSGDTLALPLAWLGAFCFMLQIYFDLAGYCDMAVGLGLMFGFTLPESFDSPYAAGSVTEMWKRWQITVSAWFRDYVYIPMGGSRKGAFRTLLHKWVVWLCAGLWYSASWCGLLGGIFSGFVMTLESLHGSGKKRRKKRKIHWYQHVYTWLFAMLCFVLLRAENLAAAIRYYRAMFLPIHLTRTELTVCTQQLTPAVIGAVVLSFLLALPFPKVIGEKLSARFPRFAEFTGSLLTLALLVLCMLSLGGAVHPQSFFWRF